MVYDDPFFYVYDVHSGLQLSHGTRMYTCNPVIGCYENGALEHWSIGHVYSWPLKNEIPIKQQTNNIGYGYQHRDNDSILIPTLQYTSIAMEAMAHLVP